MTISCDNAQTRTILLPEQAIIQLGLHCQMQTDTFLVHKLSFCQLSTFDTNNNFDYEVIDEKDILQEGDLHVKQIRLKERLDSIETMQQANEEISADITAHIKDSESLWNEAKASGQTAWGEIATWISIATSFLISAIIASWLIKLQIQVWKHGGSGGGGNMTDIQQQIDSLKSRLMDLETDIQIADRQQEEKKNPPAYNF